MRTPNQIFICQSDNGLVLKKFGKAHQSSKKGEFHQPSGITVNTKYLYVCDCGNNRVQKITQDKGIYVSQWNQCYSPKSIYYDEIEKIFYIGTNHNVYLLINTEHEGDVGNDQGAIEMKCIQKLGGDSGTHLRVIFGLYKMDDQLYVTDNGNARIQIFRRKAF